MLRRARAPGRHVSLPAALGATSARRGPRQVGRRGAVRHARGRRAEFAATPQSAKASATGGPRLLAQPGPPGGGARKQYALALVELQACNAAELLGDAPSLRHYGGRLRPHRPRDSAIDEVARQHLRRKALDWVAPTRHEQREPMRGGRATRRESAQRRMRGVCTPVNPDGPGQPRGRQHRPPDRGVHACYGLIHGQRHTIITLRQAAAEVGDLLVGQSPMRASFAARSAAEASAAGSNQSRNPAARTLAHTL